MSNRISDSDIDAILREFAEMQERDMRSTSSRTGNTPKPAVSPQQEISAPDLSKAPVRHEYRTEPRSERHASTKASLRQHPRSTPTPKPAAEARRADSSPSGSRPTFSVAYVLLIILAVFSLVWVGISVHPGTSTATASSTETHLDLVGKLDVFMNNAVSDALENVTYIKKIYTIPESDLVAPKPDPSKFGSTNDPMEVQAIVDSAAELLDGQTLSWNPGIERMEGSEIKYYYDETILVIAWKEVINHSVCTFAEVKVSHGSQLRRALSDNTYGSSVHMYASDMAKNANAVIAINGDFYDYRKLGITTYQRQLYRCKPKSVESCFFTASGDMLFSHMGELMEESEAQKFIDDNDVVFSVAFGPILVENGVKKEIYSYPIGEVDSIYSRSCIGQLDELHYLLMTVNTEAPYNHVATMNQAAEYMFNKNCYNAYALDGGQTAVIVMNGSTVNRVDWGAERTMSDIIYFATAIPEGEATS